MGAEVMEVNTVRIDKPEVVGVIIGQSHFIKTVEDIHEAMVNSVPGIKFGLAFCESSGDRLVRTTGTDAEMIDCATRNALAIAAGHVFVLTLAEGFYPINVLNAVKMVPEVCHIFCATANPLEVVIAETEQGRGVLGVVDGLTPVGVEGEEGVAWRKGLLRTIGYKL
jgi:adenosine/AMP kinase